MCRTILTRTLIIVATMFLGGCISLPFHSGVPEMEEMVVEDNDADAKVAVVDISGELTFERHERGFPFGMGRDNPIGRTREQLELAAKDPDVKAVIARISSPGGQVYPSLEIHRELLRFRQNSGKPVVAYVPDVAASGGYLVAVGADEIVADETAITGSIGVILVVPEVSGLMELIRVKVNVLKAGDSKDVGSPFREMTKKDRAELMKIADYYYGRFKELVVSGRPQLDAEQVDGVADGRVFTAVEAVENRLVDAMGDLPFAHGRAADRAGFTAANTNLIMYRRPGAYGNSVYAMSPTQLGGVQVNLGMPSLPRAQYLFLWQPAL